MREDAARRWAELEQRMKTRHRRDQIAILVGGAVGLLLTLVIGLTVMIGDQSTAALLGLVVTGACVLCALRLAEFVANRRERRSASVSRGTVTE